MPTYGSIKVNTLTFDVSGSATDLPISTIATDSDVALKADINSPTFTGSPTVPGYAALSGATFTGQINATDIVCSNNLTVNGTQTILNTETLQVEDKEIDLGKVSSPSNASASGGGIKLLGGSDGDKTITWLSSNNAWNFSEHIHLLDNKKLLVGGASGTTDGLEIVHNGSNSILNDSGTGTLQLQLGGSTKLEIQSGGINVTGAINVNGAALSAAPEITATASGAIAAHKPVIINSSGQAVEVNIPANVVGSEVNLSSGTTDGVVFATNGSGEYIVCQILSGDIKLRVATVSGTTVSLGTESSFNAGGYAAYYSTQVVYIAAKSCYMIAFKGSNNYGRVACFTVSGTSISVGSVATVNTNTETNQSIAVATTGNGSADGVCTIWYRDESSNRFWVRGYKPNTGDVLFNPVGTGTGSITGYQSGNDMNCHFNPEEQQFYGVARPQQSGQQFYMAWSWKLNSSGSPSLSGEQLLNNNMQHAQVGKLPLAYDALNKKMVVAYSTTQSDESKIRTITYNSSTASWSLGTEYNITTDCHWLSMDYFDSKIYFQYIDPDGGSDSRGVAKIREITPNSNGSFTMGTTTTIDSGSVGRGDIISGPTGLLFGCRDYNDSNRGQVRFVDIGQTNLTDENFIGFSSAAISNAASGKIAVVGNTTTQSSLTPGQKYYVQGVGTLSTTADTPSVEAGIALTSTSLLIKG